MKRKTKKLVAMVLMLAMAVGIVGMTGCGGSRDAAGDGQQSVAAGNTERNLEGETADSETSWKILVLSLKQSGSLNDGFAGAMEALKDELGFTYEVRYKGDDGSEMLSKVETAIAEGFNGIILTKDEGNTNEIVALCEQNGVYVGNIWNNQGSSLNASSGGYAFLNNPYFVGGLVDCEESMATESEAYAKAVAEAYEALPEDKKEGSIGFVTMPPAWQPAQIPAVEKIYQSLLNDYQIPESAFALNGVEKRESGEMYAGQPAAAGSYIWPSLDVTSKTLESKYFDSNPNMTLLISMLAYSFLNSGLDSANKLQTMRVWCTGFDNEEALVENFGTYGNQTYQGVRTAPVESVVMPLVQILDKLNGHSYADKEEKMTEYAQITDQNKFDLKNLQLNSSPTIVITDDAQISAYLEHNVYGTGNAADSMLDAESVKQMMVTYNSEATYENLVSQFSNESGAVSMDKVMEMAGN